MTATKLTKQSDAGKKFSKKEIAAAVADWESRQQAITRDALPSMIGSLPPPPVQWPDCMMIWMQAYSVCMMIDNNVSLIAAKQAENGNLLTTLIGLISSINACVAGHQV